MFLRSSVFGIALGLLLLGGPPAHAAKEFVYVHDRGTPNQVFGFQMSKTGTLTPVPGSPFATSAGNAGAVFCRANCQTAAYSTKRRLLFVSGTTGVSAYQVGTNGALTEVPGSPFGPAADYIGVAVVQKGRSTYVYASIFTSDQIRGFKVGASGALTEVTGSPFAAGNGPVALSTGGGKLFAANAVAGTLGHFKVENNGTLSSPFTTGVGATGVFTAYSDPKGKLVYVPENNGGNEVMAFKVGRTAFTAVTGSPFGSDTATTSGLVFGTPLLFAMTLTSSVGNDLQVYRRSAKGPLTKLVVQNSGLLGIRSGAVKKGRLVLSSDDGDMVRSFKVAANGTLTVVDTEAAGIDFANQVLIINR